MKTSSKSFLVTGSSGFIGFHLCKLLLENGFSVAGVDAMTDYYDVNLKKKRLSQLIKYPKFKSYNGFIEEKFLLDKICEELKPNIIIHLAAQAGVRYSIENPSIYANTNLIGTFNILEVAKAYKINHLLMASSSSVYGANKKLPFDELQKCDTPLSFYAATKKANEVMCHSYSHLHSIPITMFRFFTVYGPWGRPDMALFKFTNAILRNKPIDVYNFGNMERDFTYITDLINGINLLIDVVPELPKMRTKKISNDSISEVAPWRVVNIGNSSPIKLLNFIEAIERSLGKVAIKNYLKLQPGDVEITWAKIDLLKKLTDYKPETSIQSGVQNFVEWYLDYNGIAK